MLKRPRVAQNPMMGNAFSPFESASTTGPKRIGSASWTTAMATPASTSVMASARSDGACPKPGDKFSPTS